MIWIIPKSLTSVSAPATAASTSDCIAASRICAQSLTRRSKRSRASCYLREWKAGRLTRLRSGLTSSLSLGENFATEWISSQAAIRASHSVAPGSDSAEKTLATCGPTSQMEFQFCDPGCATSRTSKDTSALDSERSSSTWASLVTRRRGEYSARLSAARLINASGSLSWPTATARDFRDTRDLSSSDYRADGKLQKDVLPRAVDLDRRGHYGRPAPASFNTDGSRPESWPTPSAMDGQRPSETPQQWEARNAAKKSANPNLGELHRPLTVAVQCGTPRASIKGGHYEFDRGRHNIEEQAGASTPGGGKLNPRWVETLMGLPVGWTMPSCASPVIPESMSCASSETVSSPQSPSELSISS